jgi:NAD(P)H-dependent flavin oxidoreductase YrpB (nitropropane dioxygenase family)
MTKTLALAIAAALAAAPMFVGVSGAAWAQAACDPGTCGQCCPGYAASTLAKQIPDLKDRNLSHAEIIDWLNSHPQYRVGQVKVYNECMTTCTVNGKDK